MCTVSYVPIEGGCIITSNRDEHIARKKALPPTHYNTQTQQMVYPKDEVGNGTWIGHNQHHTIAVLLNGAFINHVPKSHYLRSRGLLVTDVLAATHPYEALQYKHLQHTQAFTLIVYSNKQLVEYRWDEHRLHITDLATHLPHVWNSATLYQTATKLANEASLRNLHHQSPLTQAQILNFHEAKRYEQNFYTKSQQNNIQTVSISQITLQASAIQFNYYPLH